LLFLILLFLTLLFIVAFIAFAYDHHVAAVFANAEPRRVLRHQLFERAARRLKLRRAERRGEEVELLPGAVARAELDGAPALLLEDARVLHGALVLDPHESERLRHLCLDCNRRRARVAHVFDLDRARLQLEPRRGGDDGARLLHAQRRLRLLLSGGGGSREKAEW